MSSVASMTKLQRHAHLLPTMLWSEQEWPCSWTVSLVHLIWMSLGLQMPRHPFSEGVLCLPLLLASPHQNARAAIA